MPNEYLGQEEFQIIAGPGRVVFLIQEGSEEGYRRAVQEACTRWGGVSEPIVPVETDGTIQGFWKQVVEFSDVDHAITIDVPMDLAIKAADSIGYNVFKIDDIDRAGIGQFTCYPSVVAPIPNFQTTTAYYAEAALTPIWYYAPDSLDLWATTAAGALTEKMRAEIQETGDAVAPFNDPMQIAIAQAGGSTLLDRTASQFAEYWASPSPPTLPAIIWITNPNSLLECLLYWNRRALRPLRFQRVPMMLLPESGIDNWLGFHNQIQHLLSGRPDEFSPDAYLISNEISHERLKAIGVSWGLKETDEKPRSSSTTPPPPVRQPPFTFRFDLDPTVSLLWKRHYGIVKRLPVQVFRDRTVVGFENPMELHGGGRYKLSLKSRVLDFLPQRAPISQMVHDNALWGRDGLQFAMWTIANQVLEIRIPEQRAVVEKLISHSTRSWKLSDKGLIGDSIASIWPVDELLRPGLYEAIRDLTTKRSDHLLRDAHRRQLSQDELDLARLIADNGGRIDRRMQPALDLASVPRDQRVAVAEALTALEWAERGYRVNCNRCGLTSFVTLDDVTPTGSCPACRGAQEYVRTDSGLTVFYRLNALMDRASDQGVLPHLLAMRALDRIRPDVFALPGVDFEVIDGTKSEADIYGIADGRVISGEVKTSASEFTDDEIELDIRRSSLLKVNIHLMACIEEISEAQKAKATELTTAHEMGLIILGPNELRPNASA